MTAKVARSIGHDSLFRYWQDVEQRLRDGIPFEIATRTEAIRRGFTDPSRFRLKPPTDPA